MTDEKIRLTQFSHGAGCGCKIAPLVLEEILKDARSDRAFHGLLVGNESGDDAAVYELTNGDCLISTADFFMPIVDDPFDYGRIAATNAISDVYAMGGKPVMAIALLGWPVEKLPVKLAQQILKGGIAACELAGIPLAGGHTIDSPEPIFGLSVTGLIKRDSIKRNNTAQAGDLLFLTKPIGTGILSTALKRKLISEEALAPAIELMCTLNVAGSRFGLLDYVHAMTDVTGFGLLGHLLEMCEGSGLSASINYADIQWIDGVESLAKQFVAPDNTFRNWKSYEPKVEGVTGERLVTLCDPQTSGGLLVAVDALHADAFTNLLREQQLANHIHPIGKLHEKKEGKWVTVL